MVVVCNRLRCSIMKKERNRKEKGNKKEEVTAGKKKGKGSLIALILIFAAGMGILLYPTFSDWWNSFHQTRAIASYVEQVAAMDTEELDRMWEEAEKYNERLREKTNRFLMSEEEVEEYNSILDATGTGIMGYIDIPKIDVSLPVYHGTDEAVLQIAIGHIEGSSLPVGGPGTHCVVSGHRGLPSAKLFTDIDRLENGDRFLLQILDRTLAYEVDQIHIVLPDELQDLEIDANEDYCTLITCTPYGVNTHRLLVRGHRVKYVDTDAHVTAEAMQFEPVIVAPLMAAPMLLILLILLLVITGRRNKKKRIAARVKEEERKFLDYKPETGSQDPGDPMDQGPADAPENPDNERYKKG